ncbi:MAG: hypothetical protein ACXVCE_12365 [Bacteriovorax sp.]
MKNPVPDAYCTYLKSIPIRRSRKKHNSKRLGKFSKSIQDYFFISEMKLEDFEKLECKKQIARLDPNQSVDLMRMN